MKTQKVMLLFLLCAWVLWREAANLVGIQGEGLYVYRPDGAYENRKECEAIRARTEQDLRERQSTRKPEENDLQLRLVCLPDTVDPRGPAPRPKP